MDDFQKKVEKGLKALPREKQVEFAWRCAIRTLPFFGAEGHFNFWKEGERQKHLLAVFRALDYTALMCFAHQGSITARSAAARSAARSASSAADASAAAASAAARSASAASAAASAAARSAYAAARSAYAAARSAYAAARSASARVGTGEMEVVIMHDLYRLGDGDASKSAVLDYGEIWNRFIQALESAGCDYWARLYQSIFENGFVLDLDALERRISIPEEILARGAAEVGRYLEDLEDEGAERLNEARIIILGDKGAGKTSLARKLIDPEAEMPGADESTAGVDTQLWKLDGMNVRIWDFAGHVVTHAVHQFFLSARCLYIVVCNGRSEGVDRLGYWLDHMKNHGGDSKAFIVVNEHDQHRVEVPFNNLKDKYGMAAEAPFSFNIKKDRKPLSAFKEQVADYILNNPSWSHQEIPKSSYAAKEALEKLFIDGGKERICRCDLKPIIDQHQVEVLSSFWLTCMIWALRCGIKIWRTMIRSF